MVTTKRISHFIAEFRWIHTGLGLIGNLSFFVGSILFLYKGLLQEIGVWLFIIGACGMLIGAVGSAIAGYERHKLDL